MKLYGSLEQALQSIAGRGGLSMGEKGISGGCINGCSVLTLSNGDKLFVKRNHLSRAGIFKTESRGLKALAGSPSGPGYRRFLQKVQTAQLPF